MLYQQLKSPVLKPEMERSVESIYTYTYTRADEYASSEVGSRSKRCEILLS